MLKIRSKNLLYMSNTNENKNRVTLLWVSISFSYVFGLLQGIMFALQRRACLRPYM